MTSERSVRAPSPGPAPRFLLRDEATSRLRDAIVKGRLAPGQVVKEADLAASLGLSVAPVRAALTRLIDEGLIESKPQSHTLVTPVSTSAVRDAAVVVRAMHEVATREAAQHLTAADVAAMRAANERFAAAVRSTVDRFTPGIRRLERQRFAAPQGQDSITLHALLFGPSPVHRLDRLTAELGGAAVWAKGEDCSSGIAFGGNKSRKREYLVADALAQGCDTLVSIGGVQSNHTRQVAAVAAHVGMRCVLIRES